MPTTIVYTLKSTSATHRTPDTNAYTKKQIPRRSNKHANELDNVECFIIMPRLYPSEISISFCSIILGENVTSGHVYNGVSLSHVKQLKRGNLLKPVGTSYVIFMKIMDY